MEETADDIKNFLKEYNDLQSPTSEFSNINPKIVGNYALNREDVALQVIDWVFNYLEDRKCPYNLAVSIAKETAEEITRCISEQQLKEIPLAEEKLLNSLTLYNEAMKKVTKICKSFHDSVNDMELQSYTLPYTASVFAVKNKRRKMEDRHVIHHDLNLLLNLKDVPDHSYYAVFDGHSGVDAASYASAHLHVNIANHPAFLTDTPTAISEAYKITDDNFNKKCYEEKLKSGTTVVCALFREKTVFLSWLGDSQAVLVKEGKPAIVTSTHKPDREDERKRIEELGGTIEFMGTYRVNGMLAVSRAIGDTDHKPFISNEPEITVINLEGNEDFLILACDGLWDGMSPEDVVTALYYNLLESGRDDPLDTVAAKLVHQSKIQGSEDNITAVVIFLRDINVIKEEAEKYVPNLSKSNWQMNFFETNGEEKQLIDMLTSTPISKPTVLEFTNSSIKKLKNTANVLNAAGLGDSFTDYVDAYQASNISRACELPVGAPETTALSELPTPPIDDVLASQQFEKISSTNFAQELDFASNKNEPICNDHNFSGINLDNDFTNEFQTSVPKKLIPESGISVSQDISPEEAVDIASTVVSNAIETAVKCISEKESGEIKTPVSAQKLNPYAEPFVMKSFVPADYGPVSISPTAPELSLITTDVDQISCGDINNPVVEELISKSKDIVELNTSLSVEEMGQETPSNLMSLSQLKDKDNIEHNTILTVGAEIQESPDNLISLSQCKDNIELDTTLPVGEEVQGSPSNLISLSQCKDNDNIELNTNSSVGGEVQGSPSSFISLSQCNDDIELNTNSSVGGEVQGSPSSFISLSQCNDNIELNTNSSVGGDVPKSLSNIIAPEMYLPNNVGAQKLSRSEDTALMEMEISLVENSDLDDLVTPKKKTPVFGEEFQSQDSKSAKEVIVDFKNDSFGSNIISAQNIIEISESETRENFIFATNDSVPHLESLEIENASPLEFLEKESVEIADSSQNNQGLLKQDKEDTFNSETLVAQSTQNLGLVDISSSSNNDSCLKADYLETGVSGIENNSTITESYGVDETSSLKVSSTALTSPDHSTLSTEVSSKCDDTIEKTGVHLENTIIPDPAIILGGISLPLVDDKAAAVLPPDHTEECHLEAVAVDLQSIPVGVPEAEGVTEDVDSDSEKDGGWSYMKGNVESEKNNAKNEKSAKPDDLKSKKEAPKLLNEGRNKVKSSAPVDKNKRLLPEKKVSEIKPKMSRPMPTKNTIEKPKVAPIKRDVTAAKTSTLPPSSKISRPTTAPRNTPIQTKSANLIASSKIQTATKPSTTSNLRSKPAIGVTTSSTLTSASSVARKLPSNQSTKSNALTAARSTLSRPAAATVPNKALSATKSASFQRAPAEVKSKPPSAISKQTIASTLKKPEVKETKELSNKQLSERKNPLPKLPSKAVTSNVSSTLKTSSLGNKLVPKSRGIPPKNDTTKDVPKTQTSRLAMRNNVSSKPTKDSSKAPLKKNLSVQRKTAQNNLHPVNPSEKNVNAVTPSEEEKLLREVNDVEIPAKELADVSVPDDETKEKTPVENGCTSESDEKILDGEAASNPIENIL